MVDDAVEQRMFQRTGSAPNLTLLRHSLESSESSLEAIPISKAAQASYAPPTPDRTPSPDLDGDDYRLPFLTPRLGDSDAAFAFNRQQQSDDDTHPLERPASAASLPITPHHFRVRSSEDEKDDVSLLEPTSPDAGDSVLLDSPKSPATASKPRSSIARLPFSLWEYLQEEIRAIELDGSQEVKSERIVNFLSVPMAVEKIIIFGFIICLDSALYTFTILPLRFSSALFVYIRELFAFVRNRAKRKRMPVSHKCDLIKGALILLVCYILHHITDASQMYHSVRGQETIKLYVIFNVLEIADRLCCSFGQDLFDSLFSRSALGRRMDGTHPHLRPFALFSLTLMYTLAHTMVLFYQLVTLNVAINSYSNALLTLLLSNQFVEIKGAVFKKFEKENLFQMSCADIVERFQLTLLLSIIALRNLIEVSGSTFSTLPASYISISVLPSMNVINRIFAPVLIVLFSEMLVDWLKHAFITKFNHIRPAVYGRFIDVLCKDLIADGPNGRRRNQPFVDQSPAVSRRLGFAAIPLGCLIVRVSFQMLDMLSDDSHIDECAPPRRSGRGWLAMGRYLGPESQAAVAKWSIILLVGSVVWGSLVVVKLLIGINLRAYAAGRAEGMIERAVEDQLNGRDRPPIGTHESERKYVTSLINQAGFDSSDKTEVKLESGAQRKTVKMENLSRFDMAKSRLY